MAYDPGAIDSALAAAVGDDPALIAELRMAFADSARRSLRLATAATDAGAWIDALRRLHNLAISFGAVRLAALAREAELRPVGDVATLRQLDRAMTRL